MTGDTSPGTVTRLLREASAGDREALDELFPHVYQELRAFARAQRHRRGATRASGPRTISSRRGASEATP